MIYFQHLKHCSWCLFKATVREENTLWALNAFPLSASKGNTLHFSNPFLVWGHYICLNLPSTIPRHKQCCMMIMTYCFELILERNVVQLTSISESSYWLINITMIYYIRVVYMYYGEKLMYNFDSGSKPALEVLIRWISHFKDCIAYLTM